MVGAAVRAACACVLWVVVSGAAMAYEVGDTWRVLDSRFVIDVVAEDLRLPVNIAFVPNPGTGRKDPFYYVTELYGTIKVVYRDGTVKDFVSGLQNYTPPGGIPGAGARMGPEFSASGRRSAGRRNEVTAWRTTLMGPPV